MKGRLFCLECRQRCMWRTVHRQTARTSKCLVVGAGINHQSSYAVTPN